ncbi:hypothetical protein LXL04_001665 [Taraxacum kok-saghyz]
MAVTNLLLQPSLIIPPKQPQLPPSLFKRRFSYTPAPSSSSTPPLSLRLSCKHAAVPITPLLKVNCNSIYFSFLFHMLHLVILHNVLTLTFRFSFCDFQEHTRFGVNKNSSAFWALSVWDNMVQSDKKFMCPPAAAKEDRTVTETDDDEAKRKFQKPTRKSGGKLSRKVYVVIIGASFITVIAVLFFVVQKQQASRCIAVPYSDLINSIHDGIVTHVQFVENSRDIYYNTNSSIETILQTEYSGVEGLLKAFIVPKWQYCTRNMGEDAFEVIKLLKNKGIKYGSDVEHLSITIKKFFFSNQMMDVVVFTLEMLRTWIWLVIRFYESSYIRNLVMMRKKRQSKKQSTTFDDVEGADAAKAELLEIVSCVKGHSKYQKLGAKVPRGVLLAGPPGTGKTLLARAVAGEANVEFFSISASEFVEVFVGTGAARVRELFGQARKRSPSIIFIDEIDAIGGQRGRAFNSERDQTLNQLLTEMDGFEKSAKVVVIAATNRPDSLDNALMRPEVPMEEDKKVICDIVASRTPGLVGADLENIAHESVLLAARRDGDFVTKKDVLQAVERAKKKICNVDYGATIGKSLYSFAQTAQESMHIRSSRCLF